MKAGQQPHTTPGSAQTPQGAEPCTQVHCDKLCAHPVCTCILIRFGNLRAGAGGSSLHFGGLRMLPGPGWRRNVGPAEPPGTQQVRQCPTLNLVAALIVRTHSIVSARLCICDCEAVQEGRGEMCPRLCLDCVHADAPWHCRRAAEALMLLSSDEDTPAQPVGQRGLSTGTLWMQ